MFVLCKKYQVSKIHHYFTKHYIVRVGYKVVAFDFVIITVLPPQGVNAHESGSTGLNKGYLAKY